MFAFLVASLLGPVPPAADVVVVPGSPSMACPAAFALRQSPYALDGRYLCGTAGNPPSMSTERFWFGATLAPDGRKREAGRDW